MKTALLLSCLLMVVSAQFGDLLSSRPFAGGKRPKLCTDNSNPRCGDGSLPVCKDGKVVDTSRFPPCGLRNGPPSCQDGSNLQCADGAEIKRPKVCNDGTSPSCPDGTPPVCPDNTPLDLSRFPPCTGGRPRCENGGRLACSDGTPLPFLDRIRNFLGRN